MLEISALNFVSMVEKEKCLDKEMRSRGLFNFNPSDYGYFVCKIQKFEVCCFVEVKKLF